MSIMGESGLTKFSIYNKIRKGDSHGNNFSMRKT